MPENPLLPHRKLRELHALMLRIRDLERKQKTTTAREALLAATSIHLLPGDLLSARLDDFTAAQLAPSGKPRADEKKPRTTGALPPVHSIPTRLALCAAAARGLQSAGTDGLVLAFTHAGAAEPGWLAALEWAQSAQLPFLLACTDPTSGLPPRSTTKKSTEPTLDYATVNRLSKRTKLPVVVVDGEDAVAVYRVMQESVIRARMGGGPAVLWAMMSSSPPKRSHQPLARLEAYLSARKISFTP